VRKIIVVDEVLTKLLQK